jgi:hypothetical protein
MFFPHPIQYWSFIEIRLPQLGQFTKIAAPQQVQLFASLC